MAAYRYFLASLVLASHLGISFIGMNIGVIAVVQFLCLTAYLMMLQFNTSFRSTMPFRFQYLHFLRDRFLRLYPQFFFYYLVTFVSIKWLHLNDLLIASATSGRFFADILVIPQNFYMFINNKPLLMPQAWSLGLESCFYLVLPMMILKKSSYSLVTAGCLSFLFYLLPYSGQVNTDIFGYRLLVGTFWIFALGASYYKEDLKFRCYRYTVLAGSFVLLLVAVIDKNIGEMPFNKEVLFGVLIIGILMENRFIWKIPFDKTLGAASYGIFLNHKLVIWFLDSSRPKLHMYHLMFITTLLISTVLSIVTYRIIEYPMSKYRRTLRKKFVLDEPPSS